MKVGGIEHVVSQVSHKEMMAEVAMEWLRHL
jgi:hypothetical protein